MNLKFKLFVMYGIFRVGQKKYGVSWEGGGFLTESGLRVKK